MLASVTGAAPGRCAVPWDTGDAVCKNGKPEQNVNEEHVQGDDTEELQSDSKARPRKPEEPADGPANQKLHF